ncbi:MAG: hypothetical protein MUE42_08995 [Opitutaceae bacterium]|jgi:hypothetical protein|nr:hypothetical protein [Opitutaceae bacterium]
MLLRRVRLRLVLAASLSAVLAESAHAQTDRFETPAFRGTAGALFAGWDDFASATGANAPDVGGSAPGGFAFTQLDPAAFVTSSGNLYSFSTVLSHRIDVTGLLATPGLVILQTRTVGGALDPASVTLETFDGSVWSTLAAPAIDLLFSGATGSPGFGSALDEARRYTWTLGSSVVATSLRLAFSAAGTSQSFQAASLDLAPASPIPEPAAAAVLAGLGAVACATLRRPRR